ncbi:C4-dicarboxylate TRAP transporter large permease protein DctM [Alcanivorax sp. ALC70]|nr:C4-dicarboxylate ABC transporter [Alcanivorax sp.]MAY10276.1 C4-dicarboxylate ABC transporter [Alcanivorax sp.]MBI53694.1 C4-dicarboxylate ABC transporter [Alcanivorax sp.]UWN50236.1 C4-dicarboxylate TRAP transporter large permease protein DctM [Alcanivorax sp. ALC70]HCE40279.1 C4-dicarboxylate ABC transporter [Alcanivorax sp.]|tara:strand:- start:165510 stop:166889 length:1380 start_codon:yes stop_codon:yes gene_type:complete
MELIPLLMFLAVGVVLLSGYPVAFCLGGVALMFGIGGLLTGQFALSELTFLPGRLFGIIENTSLMAVPLFVFMGVMLEKSRVAERLLASMGRLLAVFPGGLGLAIVLVGTLLAASTGIVGATVVTMGLLSLPTMLRHGYSPRLATGLICATGTLGQIIPPSIALVLLGDVLSTAYQEAQLRQGNWSLDTVSVGDLFVGALIPGLILVGLYLLYVLVISSLRPDMAPAMKREDARVDGVPEDASLISGLVAPLLLIVAVLGSILWGYATPTEAAGVGAFGSLLLAAINHQLDRHILRETVRGTTRVTAMVFMILIGASLFSLVFRAFGGDETVAHLFDALPGGTLGAILVVMLIVFLLGFILDFMEITFVVVPIVGPVLLAMGVDPVWLGVMIALNLQTSFLTPPFGFALFYLRGVTPPEVPTAHIYKGVIPFILIQLIMLGILALFPQLATWLPGLLYG